MGEATPKQEEAKAEPKAEEKKEEKTEAKAEEKKEEKAEEKKEEEAKPSPIVLGVDLHCAGCAKKIERLILKTRGVEEVELDMVQNQVRVKGVVDPQALCARIRRKTHRSATVVSPLPPPDAADSPQPQVVASAEVATVELHVNMHCEACAQQLRRKILKMGGVQAAETDLSSGKVMVTGTVSGDRVADYIYRRTGKVATVIPPPPPPPPPEPPKEEEKSKAEEKPAEEKKEAESGEKKEEEPKAAVENAEGGGGEKKDGGEAEKTEVVQTINNMMISPEDMMKRMMYWNGGYMMSEEEMARRMVPWMPMPMPMAMPVYMIERPPPPPQLFSDENPNACCIS